MAYSIDKKTGEISISGFEQGIFPSAHKGIANLQGVNISTETGEAMASYNRTLQSQPTGNGTLTRVNTNTVSFSPSVAVGTWITILVDSGTGLSGQYYVIDNGKLSTTFGQDNTTEVSGINAGTATFSIQSMGKPVQSATEYYTDASNNLQNRYYILDNLAQVWVHDTTPLQTVATPLWFSPEPRYTIVYSQISGLAVLNGWLSVMLDTKIFWKSTSTLGTAFVSFSTTSGNGISGTILTKKLHATLTGHTGQMYYTDGNYIGSIFPTTASALNGANIQSYASYTTGPITPVSYLVVAGGGGGYYGNGGDGGGGGGAGGLLTGTDNVTAISYSITVGTGGLGGVSGGAGVSGTNSSFDSFTAVGGGFGGTGAGMSAGNGGSGGGAGGDASVVGLPGTATAGQGHNGGTTASGSNRSGGGGGGAGTAGGTGTSSTAGNGGNGTASSISGSSVTYAGGGGGGATTTAGTGGTGGGGAGGSIGNASNATGFGSGGGGGGAGTNGGNGSGGIVVISYPTGSITATGGTVTTSGGNTIHTFTASGTWTVTSGGILPTTGVITAILSGAYPNTGSASANRIPATFFTTSAGSQPSNLTVGTTYWISNTPGLGTFQVFTAQTGGSAIDINTGSAGPQFYNTFNPISNGGASYLVSTQIKCTLPTFETAQCLAEVGSSIVIGGVTNTIYNWDGISLTAQYVFIPENNVVAIISVNNTGYIFAGQKGNIYITNGSSVSPVISVPDYCAGIAGSPATYVEPYFAWGGACYVRGRLYFSIQDQTSAKIGNCGGIWSFIPTQNQFLNQDQGMALRLENQSSYATYNGACSVLLASQQQNAIAPQFWSGWYSNITMSTYGIDFTDVIPAAQAIIETDLVPTGTQLVNQTYQQVEYKLATPLATGESIGINYRLNATDAWQSCGTVKAFSANELSGYFTANFQDTQWLQLQVILNTVGNSTSSFCRLVEIMVR